jgi:hypothetical protein
MQGFDTIKLTPCSTETYNLADLAAHYIRQTNDTNENYRNGLIPP